MKNYKIPMVIGTFAAAASLILVGCSTAGEATLESEDTNSSSSLNSVSDNAESGIDITNEQLTPTSVTPEGSFQITNESSLNEESYRVDLFFDPACGACQQVESVLGEKWLEQAQSGEIDLHVTPVPFLDFDTVGDYSTRTSNAFVTIAEEDPEMAMKFLAKIYEPSFFPNHGRTHRETSDLDIAKAAQDIGASDELLEKISDHQYVEWLTQNTEKLAADTNIFPEGISTPTVLFNLEYDEEGKSKSDSTKVKFTGSIEEDYNSQVDSFKESK